MKGLPSPTGHQYAGLSLVEEYLSDLGTNTFPLGMWLITQHSLLSFLEPQTNVAEKATNSDVVQVYMLMCRNQKEHT